MRTTIDINDAKLSRLRELATQRRRPLRQILDEVLTLGLAAAAPAVSSASPARLTLPTRPIGLKPAFHGLSLNQLYDQLEVDAASPPARSFPVHASPRLNEQPAADQPVQP